MKWTAMLLGMCAALSCVSCSAFRCGGSRTVLVGGGKCVEELVAGGKCRAKLTYDEKGKLIDVNTDPPCERGLATRGLWVTTNEPPLENTGSIRQPLVENTGSITFGTETSTCYGPPIPSPPVCICTRKPCP